MEDDEHRDQPVDGAKSNARFTATHWSLILRAKGTDPTAKEALDELCRKYWYPLYAFLRHAGETPHDAQDLTQGLFEDLCGRDWLAKVTSERPEKFRSFLLTCLKNFRRRKHRDERRERRAPNGQPLILFDPLDAEERFSREPTDSSEPSRLFDIKWAETLVGAVIESLRKEHSSAKNEEQFDALLIHMLDGAGHGSYGPTASKLGMSEGAVRVAVHRMRKRYGELLRTEVAGTVLDPHEVEEEIRHLMSLWSR